MHDENTSLSLHQQRAQNRFVVLVFDEIYAVMCDSCLRIKRKSIIDTAMMD